MFRVVKQNKEVSPVQKLIGFSQGHRLPGASVQNTQSVSAQVGLISVFFIINCFIFRIYIVKIFVTVYYIKIPIKIMTCITGLKSLDVKVVQDKFLFHRLQDTCFALL